MRGTVILKLPFALSAGLCAAAIAAPLAGRMSLLLTAATSPAPVALSPATYRESPRLVVSLSNFKFAPAVIHMKAGQPVILQLINRGRTGHDFTAPEFFAAATVDPADASRIKRGKVEVAGRTQVLIALTPAAGHFTLKCGHPLHKGFGMTGDIAVDW